MTLKFYQVDSFTNHILGGNPAAVIPLTEWLSDDFLQAIAFENNLSETAYFIQQKDYFELRWFTSIKEVNLCSYGPGSDLFERRNYGLRLMGKRIAEIYFLPIAIQT